jgi:Tol biopolymer transport system component
MTMPQLGTDGFGSQILFTSQRDGNWELYLINANGAGLRNLSNSSGSNDGLGTFSPDGKWVAFVSNRGGSWAIWAVRPDGTGLTKLFDLPAPLTGNWIDERISWGP